MVLFYIPCNTPNKIVEKAHKNSHTTKAKSNISLFYLRFSIFILTLPHYAGLMQGQARMIMLEKLAKQTAIYGISTIVVRFLNYLLTPYYTRIFDQGEYGIVTDIYALIPFALVIGKVFYKMDIRNFGSKNLGGGNAGRVLGKKAGLSVMTLDIVFRCLQDSKVVKR